MYNWRKGIASWVVGKSLYLSVPFTWLMDEAEQMAAEHKGPVIAGGPAVDLIGADWAETPGQCEYDTLSLHNPLATFTTRGCPNKCAFCAVPKIEGDLRELAEWKPAPVVCDNNFLAASKKHIAYAIGRLRIFPRVDFNQGLDARLLTDWHITQLSLLQSVKIRFAFDNANEEGAVADAIQRVRKAGLRDISVYVLIGFQDSIDEALHKLWKVLEWKTLPCPMRYQPLDVTRKNEYLASGWTEYEMQKMQRYFWNIHRVRNIPYEEFVGCGYSDMPLFEKAGEGK